MCTYVTENVPVSGSAKGPEGWFSLSRATVCFDHPFHAPLEHSLTSTSPIRPIRPLRPGVSTSS